VVAVQVEQGGAGVHAPSLADAGDRTGEGFRL
jgi:hypothetical protein